VVYTDAIRIFATGGILCTYKVTNAIQIQRKFKQAESIAKGLWERRGHQNDQTGENDEGELPAYARAFFEYFEFSEDRVTANTTAAANRQRNLRVNRSIVGQQPALTSDEVNILNPTTAAPGRERGTGEIAGEVTINEVVQGVSSEDNSSVHNNRVTAAMFPLPTSPNRRTGPNDNRRGSNRGRNYNLQFSPNLPPSTGSARALDIDRMQHGYTSIAESINNLAYQQRIRRVVDINKDLVNNLQLKADMQAAEGDEHVIEQLSQTIADLQQERIASREYELFVTSRIRTMYTRDQTNSSVSGSDSNVLTSDFENSDV